MHYRKEGFFPVSSMVKTLLLLIILTQLFSNRAGAQCTPTPAANGSVFGNDATIGTVSFSNPDFAQSDDGTYATATSTLSMGALLSTTHHTNYLTVTGFGFSIPANATICGITVQVKRRARFSLEVGSTISDNVVSLIKNGTITGDNKKSGASWPELAAYVTYGGTTDLWGTLITPADVNAGNFGLAIAATITNPALLGQAVTANADIDHIEMTVSYSTFTVLPVVLANFSTVLKDNSTLCRWAVTEQEEGATITLQRSADDWQWRDLIRYDGLTNSKTRRQYAYEDGLEESGRYAYRLRVTYNSGNSYYSKISSIDYYPNGSMAIFPVPATTTIRVTNADSNAEAQVTNTLLQTFRLPVTRLDKKNISLDIRWLPKGIYFLRINKQVRKFVKL